MLAQPSAGAGAGAKTERYFVVRAVENDKGGAAAECRPEAYRVQLEYGPFDTFVAAMNGLYTGKGAAVPVEVIALPTETPVWHLPQQTGGGAGASLRRVVVSESDVARARKQVGLRRGSTTSLLGDGGAGGRGLGLGAAGLVAAPGTMPAGTEELGAEEELLAAAASQRRGSLVATSTDAALTAAALAPGAAAASVILRQRELLRQKALGAEAAREAALAPPPKGSHTLQARSGERAVHSLSVRVPGVAAERLVVAVDDQGGVLVRAHPARPTSDAAPAAAAAAAARGFELNVHFPSLVLADTLTCTLHADVLVVTAKPRDPEINVLFPARQPPTT
mmetsp:Transcript_10644/g.35009  ORF Transcript_10644/g.35009 Transcript_10644/m.35009 type:complete len:336 (+) Transcript_10644:802-1809(+)